MVFLGLEQPVAYGRQLVFDPTTALMVLNANRDYINAVYNDYQQARQDMKEFNEKYGNFSSPFAKDMERFNLIVGGIQNGVEELYKMGIDPLRSSEGRAYITRMINNINPAELAAMKSNSKLGYAYLDAMLALRKSGKYSQALEDFDIALNGETAFNDFATGNGVGGFNMWGRTSPIEATTLRDLTYDSYKGRVARDITRDDFVNDPRLKNYAYDPRYQYSGYLDSDLMKVAPGASASIAADPRAAFFRDQARQKVIASGKEPTAEAVEAQFQRDIADANAWALIDPTKKADEFAKINLEHRNKMEEIREAGKYKGNGSGDGGDNNDGNYLRAIGIDAARANMSAGIRIGMDNSEVFRKINNKYKNDPVKRQKAVDNATMELFFKDKKYGDGKKNVLQIIKSLPSNDTMDGHQSVNILNSILRNFAANSDDVNNGKYLLEKAGYVYNESEKHWEPGLNANGKIVSPHELMRNIINFEFTGNLNGVSKKELNDILESSAGGYGKQPWYDISWRAPGEIAAGATAIYPDAADHGVMIAPDETGAKRLWVRVGLHGGGMFKGDSHYKGYWLSVPIEYGQDGLPTSTSEASIYSSGVHERKDYGNAAVTAEFNSLR